MQNNQRIKLAALLVSLLLVLSVSCQKKTVAVENQSNSIAQQGRYEASTADQSNAGEKTLDSSAAIGDSDIVLKKDIFFEFDKATLTPEAIETLTKNGQWLRTNSDVAITIEGHCDERGTNAYNLALGERRAGSVKTFLAGLGVDQSRLATISYGEERPFERGHGETVWTRNRRAHFLIR
jgi:peptidoglycan-associated lipoprotein